MWLRNKIQELRNAKCFSKYSQAVNLLLPLAKAGQNRKGRGREGTDRKREEGKQNIWKEKDKRFGHKPVASFPRNGKTLGSF